MTYDFGLQICHRHGHAESACQISGLKVISSYIYCVNTQIYTDKHTADDCTTWATKWSVKVVEGKKEARGRGDSVSALEPLVT